MKTNVLLNLLNITILLITAVIIYVRLIRDHRWEKRYASQEVLFKTISDDINNTRKSLESEYNISIYDPNKDFKDDIQKVNNKKDFKFKTKRVLNFLEMVSAGIKNGIIDEEICYEYLHVIFINYYRWSKPYINEIRSKNRPAYRALEEYALKWKERLDEKDKASSMGSIFPSILKWPDG